MTPAERATIESRARKALADPRSGAGQSLHDFAIACLALLDALAEAETDHERMRAWITVEHGACPTMATEAGRAVLAAYEAEAAKQFDCAQHNARLGDEADGRARTAEALVVDLRRELEAIGVEQDEIIGIRGDGRGR